MRGSKGFELIELIMVSVIIGILVAVAIPIINNKADAKFGIVETVDGQSFINGVEIQVLPPDPSLVDIERLPVPSPWVAETIDVSAIMHDCYFVIYRDPDSKFRYMVQVVLKYESTEILSVSTTRIGR